MWAFMLGLALWGVFLLWTWAQVGRSLNAPIQRDEERAARQSADSDRAASQ